MNKVIRVTPLDDKKLAITFADGLCGVFDVNPYIRSDFFLQLNDEDYFKKVGIFFGGVSWPDGQDLGPDTIATELQK